MAAKQVSLGPRALLGLAVKCPATLFGVAWAKRTHGREYLSVFYDGHVESFVPKGESYENKVMKQDIWLLKFPDDDKLYRQNWVGLRKWLQDKSFISGKPKSSHLAQV